MLEEGELPGKLLNGFALPVVMVSAWLAAVSKTPLPGGGAELIDTLIGPPSGGLAGLPATM